MVTNQSTTSSQTKQLSHINLLTTMSTSRLVILDYADVSSDPSSKDLSSYLERAFGGSSSSNNGISPLGIVAIRNIPGFVAAKNALLPQGHTLAHLDESYLDKHLTDAASLYNAGWSRGKEKLGDKPDYAKASYYFNPLSDVPGTEEDRAKYPASYPCNKWPNEDETDLQGFKDNAKNLGNIMHKTVVLLSRHIDNLAARKVKGYKQDLLYNAMKETEKAKGRLLYYYPLEESNDSDAQTKPFDNWIGWHNDSGFLTSLSGDLYVNATGKSLDKSEIDPAAGLYVTDRSGESIHVSIPEDCMAVQIGEVVQILTGGVVSATPHCVRGPSPNFNGVKVARISCPCFIDSKPIYPLVAPEGCSREQVVNAGIGREKVPALEDRWTEDGMSFGDFLQKTFERYYDWKG
jgi:isopenicillin N synthase-like dioxygenase